MIKKEELINITGNLVNDIKFDSFERNGEFVDVANFTLVSKKKDKKEYIDCSVYGRKIEIAQEFQKGDLIHVYGYFKETVKEERVYKNFIVKSLNKSDKKMKKEEI